MYWQDILTITSACYAGVSLTALKILIGVQFHHTRKLRKKLAQKTLTDAQFHELSKYLEIQRKLRVEAANIENGS